MLSAILDWSGPDDGSASVIKALAAFALIARTPTVTTHGPGGRPAGQSAAFIDVTRFFKADRDGPVRSPDSSGAPGRDDHPARRNRQQARRS